MSELELLKQQNEALRKENTYLVQQLAECHDSVCSQITVMTVLKKDIRRYEVQLNSLKAENAALKAKFDKIENNFIGRLLLKVYRILRELKHRKG
ncbi:MAG: hypothetical protein IJZ35_08540 [Clostridia bacterium]|nr:hypothetical protein [Clostridia bacterium]